MMRYTWAKDTNSGTGKYLNLQRQEVEISDDVAAAALAEKKALEEAG